MPRKKLIRREQIVHDSCINCRFWNRLDDAAQMPAEDVIGECRRKPPTVVGIDLGTESPIQSFPETMALTWCGEHGRAIN